MSPKLGDEPLSWVLREAQEEAQAARHGYFGVEHLLAVLARGRSRLVAEVLADHGVTYARAQDAVREVVDSGRGDGPAWGAPVLLGTLGIDLDEVRRRVQARFGANAIDELYASPVGLNLRPRGPLCGPQVTRSSSRRSTTRSVGAGLATRSLPSWRSACCWGRSTSTARVCAAC